MLIGVKSDEGFSFAVGRPNRRLGDRQRADCMNQQNQRETSYHRLPFQMVQQDCLIVVKDSFEDILHSTRALFANEPAFAFQNPLSSPRIRFKS